MTPTHKDLVEALREAKKGLDNISRITDCYYPNWCDACNEPEHYKHEPSWEAKLAQETLSKINPILKELEGE